jgi:prevent-host-death family protein
MVKEHYNVHEAKTNFSRLLEIVESGHEVVIARAGTPVAKLVAIPKAPKKRVLGGARGTVEFAPDWDAPMTDREIEEFLGH